SSVLTRPAPPALHALSLHDALPIFAAAALGYNVWWVTAIGQETAQKAMRPLLGVPEELSIIDIFCFGPAAKTPYKRWKKKLDERSEEHTSELQSPDHLVCRLLLEKK